MSRIGRLPVEVPSGVDVKINGSQVKIKGPKGEMEFTFSPSIDLSFKDGEINVTRPSDAREMRSLHGTTRALIQNMIIGVTDGFQKELQLVGVGYRADVSDNGITVLVGYSHPIKYPAPEGVTLECPNQTTIVVSGADKQKVGQTAAEIRAFRPPEPYKGKGIRYRGEQVRRKAGKTAGA